MRDAIKAWETEAAERATLLLIDALFEARNHVLTSGTEPLPATVRLAITGFFSEELLEGVRHRIGFAAEPPALAALFLLPQVRAMTLGSVIVFRDQETARDIRIWVHELGHVEQFARWGTAGFAERYVRDPGSVESEAWETFERFDAWARAQGRIAANDYRP